MNQQMTQKIFITDPLEKQKIDNKEREDKAKAVALSLSCNRSNTGADILKFLESKGFSVMDTFDKRPILFASLPACGATAMTDQGKITVVYNYKVIHGREYFVGFVSPQ